MNKTDKSQVKSLLLLLVLLNFLPLSVEARNCPQDAIQGLLDTHAVPRKKSPASYREFQDAQLRFLRRGNRPEYVMHIRGEFKYMKHSQVPQLQLDSGLHSNEALEFLKSMRPDLAPDISLKVMPNGVQVATLPQEAFTQHRKRYLLLNNKTVNGREIIYTEKTLFPKAWSEDEIMKAVENVKNNRASFKKVKEGAMFITGTYQGVKIRVVLRNGEIKTAFPLAR